MGSNLPDPAGNLAWISGPSSLFEVPRVQWHMYRSTEDKLNDAFARIYEGGGDVVSVFHKGARDYSIIYTTPGKP
jgi:hypothetical protein